MTINYTYLEDYIISLYKTMRISKPHQLEINHIANHLQLKVHYSSVSFRLGNVIVLQNSSKQREWQSFGHEVGHCLGHVGNQLKMFYMFRELQEWQANTFAYHFCVPTYMLEEINNPTVYEIMTQFNVEEDFAHRRLE
ncbi:ImmA/IrrE family metallo-endopeptidase [Oceanobacillus saliphilus]|uniref:ImmA/IrrE family metallo-endopeptidase n=1 Tax=Oceanobacillus saliphilus TaxID=2925834 RepID=UPI00201DAA82|nr:ImmA/IrrE family metallo-endopeptidase [Oceanobacillus saliphilus]